MKYNSARRCTYLFTVSLMVGCVITCLLIIIAALAFLVKKAKFLSINNVPGPEIAAAAEPSLIALEPC